MNAGDIIYGVLTADSAVAALVSTRIYPVDAPLDVDLPCVYYDVALMAAVDGSAPMSPVQVQVGCLAHTEAAMQSLADAVDAAINGLTRVSGGTWLRSVMRMGAPSHATRSKIYGELCWHTAPALHSDGPAFPGKQGDLMAVADILLSPAKIYFAAVGTALPNATSVAYGAAWSGWSDLGYTLTPITVGYTQDIFKLEVEQITLPVKGMITNENVTIETTLAEITAANMMLAFGGSVATTAAGTGQVALEELKSGGSPNISYYAWGLEGLYVTATNVSLPVRVLIYRGSAVLNGSLTWSKKEPVGIPLQISAWADTTKAAGAQLWTFQKVTAPVTT